MAELSVSTNPAARRLLPPVALSTALHILVIAGLLLRPASTVAPMRLPGTAHGSRIELTYTPGRAPVRASVPTPHSTPVIAAAARALPSVSPLAPSKPLISPNSTATPSVQPDSVAGADALGDGNVSIALAAFFPPPRPDLSSLARGTAGDVILDIVIDSAGQIADIKLTHGLTPVIDATVIDTVHRWTFHPATKDGQPIASEQELHFHYERG